MTEPGEKGGGGASVGILLIVLVAVAVGVLTALHNANTPLAKQQKATREAERAAQVLCRRAGCPDDCYYAGMCDR